ncbi:hypothetical protein ATCVNTS1_199R [Acanthocystis turfacea Chlorella virus NTS-1]|nr:hypothetical protein ATCVNTS1_199R [Acanthocystis turfacea Chlorella virus NTS-1]
MTTLKYYFSDGRYKSFDKYTIDEYGVIQHATRGNVLTRAVNFDNYNSVTVFDDDGKHYGVRVARAIASTFLGEPPTVQHTADHIDNDRQNDVLSNIRWLCKHGQSKNRTMSPILKNAFIIMKDGIEKTANEWLDALKDDLNPYGRKYTKCIIQQYAQKNQHGFSYKVFEDLHEELWKSIEGSNNEKNGEWFISSEGRMKYKTKYAENILDATRLNTNKGYPVVKIGTKLWYCHILSFKVFYPEKYAAKKDDEEVLHIKDNKLDFRPTMLYMGNRSQNRFDAYDNGKRDSGKTARKPCVSYINGILEKDHPSVSSAVIYLKNNGHPLATVTSVIEGIGKNKIRYGRTWE